jgi:hypothetical protein
VDAGYLCHWSGTIQGGQWGEQGAKFREFQSAWELKSNIYDTRLFGGFSKCYNIICPFSGCTFVTDFQTSRHNSIRDLVNDGMRSGLEKVFDTVLYRCQWFVKACRRGIQKVLAGRGALRTRTRSPSPYTSLKWLSKVQGPCAARIKKKMKVKLQPLKNNFRPRAFSLIYFAVCRLC